MALTQYSELYWLPDGTLAANMEAVVYDLATPTLAPLFQDLAGTIPIPNPTTTDGAGLLSFVIEEGSYWVHIDNETFQIDVGAAAQEATIADVNAAIAAYNADTTAVGRTRAAIRTSDLPRGDATVLDDTQLTLSVVAGGTYTVETFLDADGALSGDIQFGWSAPAGSVMTWTESGPSLGNTNNIASIKYNRLGVADLGTTGILPTGTSFTPSGRLTVGGTAGSLTFRWAQAANDATPTTLRTGSWIKLYRVS